ncbi:MAG: hypothetical protein BWY82_01030 [Verrucomicrobia bacterium ADurb.Bin474]|nr:MAG: hypothetical protein BWY82_01030 [Verrucomicrobia bacterium ADurb.Bin474]
MMSSREPEDRVLGRNPHLVRTGLRAHLIGTGGDSIFYKKNRSMGCGFFSVRRNAYGFHDSLKVIQTAIVDD